MYEDRIERAVSNYKNGYNCTQAVVEAFADLFTDNKATALALAASFGGGIGKMRLTCGAACGAFMLAGLATCAADPTNMSLKAENTKSVQTIARKFKEENGSMTCGELLGLVKPADPSVKLPPKRPCTKMIETAARLFAEYLETKDREPRSC